MSVCLVLSSICHKFIDYIICVKDVEKAAAIATTFVQENGQQADSGVEWTVCFITF